MPRSPPQQRNGVRQVQLVPAAALRRACLLVTEDGEIIGVGRLWPRDRVAQYMSFGMHLMTGNDGAVRIAEQARVHPGKVPEVGEVLDLPRRVATPAVRTSGDDGPVVILELGDLGQRPARLRHPHPAKSETPLP